MIAQRHPVADLLTEEMRDRVRAATFERNDDPNSGWRAGVVAEVRGRLCCPMGVALGKVSSYSHRFPIADQVAAIIGRPADEEAIRVIDSFINMVDGGEIKDPADVYRLLGCEP